MTKRRSNNKFQCSGTRLLMGYGVLAIVGFGLGFGAAPADKSTQKAEDQVVEKVRHAFEQIINDAKVGRLSDAGVDDNHVKEGIVPYTPSPEPDAGLSDGGVPEYRRLPVPDSKGGSDKVVVIIEIEEIIDMGLSAFVERTIEDNADAAALILKINTPGGRIDAATKIRDAIMEAPKTMRTVAFISPRAISAGAFISLACDLIFIADGGSIGAATPISISGGEAAPVDEKMVSYFRTEMATTARAKGRRGDIAEAMVDYEVEIEGITKAGKLLTLDTAGALRWKIADKKANSIDEVLEILALGKAERKSVILNWAEELARIFTHPILSGILMSIGVLGILIELYHPGFGLPGIVGITCLVIFFAGHLVVNLAGWEEVLLFVIGVALIGVEIFVTPGFGILGAGGLLAIVFSLVLSLTALPIDVSFEVGNLTDSLLQVLASLTIALVLFFVTFAFLPKLPFKSKLILDTAISATSSGGREKEAIEEIMANGVSGVAESFLRPAGIARFGDKRIDVISEGDFIEKGETVIVVRTAGNKVVVKKEG
jgi:membrane-bound serine protease (ClpP class)